MKRLWRVCLMPLLMVSALGQAALQGISSTVPDQTNAAVDSFYKVVMARHPFGIPDLDVFHPYLSKKLLDEFGRTKACFENWRRENPDPKLKPPGSLGDYALLSGGNKDMDPQTFHLDRTESLEDGTYRVDVKLISEDSSRRLTWYVAAVVARENGRPVVDDILYLKGTNRDIDFRLSDLLKLGCQGSG